MNAKINDFDAQSYFASINKENKLLKNNRFFFSRVTGLGNMEEVIQTYKKSPAYLCVDDTNDGHTFQGGSGGYFERRMYTVFILHRYDMKSMSSQSEKLNLCRNIYSQICSKLINDKRNGKSGLTFLKTDRIPFYELEGYALNGVTGLYFMFNIEKPINLCYDANQWEK